MCDVDAVRPAVINVMIVLNLTLNVLVTAMIVRHPQLREDSTTVFMLSVTLSDLANRCQAMPISAALCFNATPNVRNNTSLFGQNSRLVFAVCHCAIRSP